jgi:hypothetical protein
MAFIRKTLGVALLTAFTCAGAHGETKDAGKALCDVEKTRLHSEIDVFQEDMKLVNSMSVSDVAALQPTLQIFSQNSVALGTGADPKQIAQQEASLNKEKVFPFFKDYFAKLGFTVQGIQEEDEETPRSTVVFHLARKGVAINVAFNPFFFLKGTPDTRTISFYTEGHDGRESSVYFDSKQQLQFDVLAPRAFSTPAPIDEYLNQNIPACKQTAGVYQAKADE